MLSVGSLSPRHERVEAQQEEHVEEEQADDADNDYHYNLQQTQSFCKQLIGHTIIDWTTPHIAALCKNIEITI